MSVVPGPAGGMEMEVPPPASRGSGGGGGHSGSGETVQVVGGGGGDTELEVMHAERLTEDLIDCIEDIGKLRSLFVKFYKKSSWSEKEHQKFKAEQLRKLQEAESRNEVFKEELYKKIYEALEQDLNCSICSELFVQPSVLECGHTFCAHCIGQWKNGGNRACPICRQYIFRPVTKNVGLGNFLTKFHTMLSQEIRDRRDQLILERGQQAQPPPAIQNNNSRPCLTGAHTHNPNSNTMEDDARMFSTLRYAMTPGDNHNVTVYRPGGTNMVPSIRRGFVQQTQGSIETTAVATVNPAASVVNGTPNTNSQDTVSNPLNGPPQPRNAAVIDRLRARIQAYRTANSSISSTTSSTAIVPTSNATLGTGITHTSNTSVPSSVAPATAPAIDSPGLAPTALTSSPFYQSLVSEIETLRQNLDNSNRRTDSDFTRAEDSQQQQQQIRRTEVETERNRLMFPYANSDLLLDEEARSRPSRTIRSPHRHQFGQINERANLDFEGAMRARARAARRSRPVWPAHGHPRVTTYPRRGAIPLPPPATRYLTPSESTRRRESGEISTTEPGVRIEFLSTLGNNRDQSRLRSAQSSQGQGADVNAEDWLNYDPLEMGDLDFVDHMQMHEENEDEMIMM